MNDDDGEVTLLLLRLMMKQTMKFDKSDRVDVMLVFEDLPVQFYELVGSITWSDESSF